MPLNQILEDRNYSPSCSEEFGDFSFAVDGKSIPIDHAQFLYGSICRILPEFHEHNSIGIFGINGKFNQTQTRRLELNCNSRLKIRLPLDRSRLAYKLAGKYLQLDQDKVYLHIPELELILPSPTLQTRIAIIKGFQDANSFANAAQYHLEKLSITGKVRMSARFDGQPRCRTIMIHCRKIVGFAFKVDGLSDQDSLILQQEGIGGRRKYGCGLFTPY